MEARIEWRESLGADPERRQICPGITPVKKKQAEAKRVVEAQRKAGGRLGVDKKQSYCCRLVYITFQPDFYDDYVQSEGGADGAVRSEQDAREVRENHRFYQRAARVMSADMDGATTTATPSLFPTSEHRIS